MANLNEQFNLKEQLEESAQKTKQLIEGSDSAQGAAAQPAQPVLDDSKYAGLIDPYDLSDNPSDDDVRAKWYALSPADKKEFNLARGFQGINPYSMQRGLLDEYAKDIKKRRIDEEKAAAQKAIDDANETIKIPYGDGQNYEVTRDFSDWYKRFEQAYAATNDAATRANLVTQLSEKMKAAGLPAMDYAAKENDPNPFATYMEQFVGDIDAFDNLQKVLEAAGQDRTPKMPEKKSWEDLWFERQEKRAALDRDKENRRLEGERLGLGIGDLSAIIGDMVRAHEGAPVTQRDWQKYYDELSAQEKANLNNYRVRMQKLAEDQRNLYLQRKAKEAAAKAAAEKDAADKGFKAGQAALDRKLKWDIANLEDKRNRYYAYLRWGQGGSGDKSKTHTLLLVGDKAMLIPNNQSFTNAVNSLYEILNKKENYTSGTARITITDKSELETDPQGFFNRNIQNVLSNYWDDIKPEVKTKIIKKLQAMQGEWVSGAPAKGTSDSSNNTVVEDSGKDFDPEDVDSWFK